MSSPLHIFYYNFFEVFSFSKRTVYSVVGCENHSHWFSFLAFCSLFSFTFHSIFLSFGFRFVYSVWCFGYFKIFHKIVFRYLDSLSHRVVLFILLILQLQFFFCCNFVSFFLHVDLDCAISFRFVNTYSVYVFVGFFSFCNFLVRFLFVSWFVCFICHFGHRCGSLPSIFAIHLCVNPVFSIKVGIWL